MGFTGDVGRWKGRLQLVIHCSARKKPKALGLDEQKVEKVCV